ncbi:Trk system potassium uptake protein TrkA [Streptococcus sp. DD10]|nr:Trk system potassium uptake protein TrkA [Streptococcus sp. DD10]
MVVNPESLTARYIANNIDFPSANSVEYFANGRVILMEFLVKKESPLANMTLSHFRRKFSNILVCAIEREENIFIPNGDVVIEENDTLYITGNRIEMVLFHSFLRPRAVRNLLLIGAGKIAYYLLNILKDTKVKVKVIESSRERAQWFSQEFPQVHVVLGDGTAKEILLEESALNFDAVATLTGVDEENIITSMFLDNIGISKIITKVNRTSLLEILDEKDFSSIVTPKLIATDTIMHFIRGRVNAQHSNLEALHHVANGQIETLQFFITESCKITGKTLAALKLKKGVLIAAIIRNGRTIFPDGNDSIQIGDKIIVITLIQNVNQVTDLLAR